MMDIVLPTLVETLNNGDMMKDRNSWWENDATSRRKGSAPSVKGHYAVKRGVRKDRE